MPTLAVLILVASLIFGWKVYKKRQKKLNQAPQTPQIGPTAGPKVYTKQEMDAAYKEMEGM